MKLNGICASKLDFYVYAESMTFPHCEGSVDLLRAPPAGSENLRSLVVPPAVSFFSANVNCRTIILEIQILVLRFYSAIKH